MHFIVDEKRKIAFGYSAKTGCSHIKRIFWYLTEDNLNHQLHKDKREYSKIPDDYKNYTFILIVRNPYKRLVSGFLDKYNSNPMGELRSNFKKKEITFEDFVGYVVREDCKDPNHVHHFIPQTRECFNYEKLNNGKKLVVYDIESINYSFIESLYNKKIPGSLLEFKGPHSNKNIKLLEKPVFSLDIINYNNNKVPIKYFYNKSILSKVQLFYKNDFDIFKLWNIHYQPPI